MAGFVVPARDAVDQVLELVKPAAPATAAQVAASIREHVPVVHGGAIKTYDLTVESTDEGARIVVGSPLWHLIEFGTATSPPYRPIELGVRALGVRFEPL